MKNSVVIKGNKYGIIVVLDKELPFEELKEEIAAKFRDSAKFLGEASMGITFHGRDLSDEEMQYSENIFVSEVFQKRSVIIYRQIISIQRYR